MAVVNVKTEAEYKKLMLFCESIGLEGAGRFLKRISFYSLHTDCGVQVHPFGDICIEYQPFKGFTMGDRKSYKDYGLEILSVDEIVD